MRTITLNADQKAQVVNAVIDRIRDQSHWTPSRLVSGKKVRWLCKAIEQSMIAKDIADALGTDSVDIHDVNEDDLREIIACYMPLVKLTRGVEWVDDEE